MVTYDIPISTDYWIFKFNVASLISSFNQMRYSIKETITNNHHPHNYHAIITISHRYLIYKMI